MGRCAAYRAAREGRIPVVMTGERTMRVPTVKMLRLLGFAVAMDTPTETQSATLNGTDAAAVLS